MLNRWNGLLVMLLAGGIALPLTIRAEGLETAVMPGKVIEGHAKLEGECKNCHVRFNKSAQSGLCQDCHEGVKADVARKAGYHGRIPQQECRACHTDHKGRQMNIVVLDEKKFDHTLTDFPLKGGHAAAKVQCKDCHQQGKKHRDAPSDCYACHQQDDKHKGSLGKACADCHSEKNWKDTRFDHSKTKFPLTGKHRDVSCKECHSDPKFKGAPLACVGCHRKDDDRKGHKGTFGDKCETCHTDRDWKTLRFNHDRDTKYSLKGKHAQAKCSSCHTGVLYKEKTPTTCYACHQQDDKHKGQEGKQCENCHNEADWKKARFDHGLSRFPLLGKHEKVECKKCHLTPQFRDAKSECIACHRKDDKHKLRLGPRCEDCHNAVDWKKWRFDHDHQTRFRLDGAHKGLDCLACHRKPSDRRISIPGSCASCHADDDVHEGGFGNQCQRCHETSSFKKLLPGVLSTPRGKP